MQPIMRPPLYARSRFADAPQRSTRQDDTTAPQLATPATIAHRAPEAPAHQVDAALSNRLSRQLSRYITATPTGTPAGATYVNQGQKWPQNHKRAIVYTGIN